MTHKESETIGVKKSTNESPTVEWKQSVAEIDEIIETAAAFANTEGGRIFIGVSPEGKKFRKFRNSGDTSLNRAKK